MPSSLLPPLALGLLAFGTAAHAAAQEPASAAALCAVVVDSGGTALPYATVRVESLGREALTDAAGRFVVASVSAGPHPVLVRQVGYAPWRGALAGTPVAGE